MQGGMLPDLPRYTPLRPPSKRGLFHDHEGLYVL